jgi:hypothetical protein
MLPRTTHNNLRVMRFLCFTNSAIYDTQPALIPSYFDPAHRFVFFDGDIFECESADDVAKDDGGEGDGKGSLHTSSAGHSSIDRGLVQRLQWCQGRLICPRSGQ